MKKLLYYSSLIFLITCISCDDDFLDTTSPSKLSSETVFKTSSMAKAAIMGVYGRMTDTNIYGQKLSVNWQGFSDIEPIRDLLQLLITLQLATKEQEIFMTIRIIKQQNGRVCFNWPNWLRLQLMESEIPQFLKVRLIK